MLDNELPEHQGRAERAFRRAYLVEYLRLCTPGPFEDLERLKYRSEMALMAGKIARERVLSEAATASERTHPVDVWTEARLSIAEKTAF